VAALAELLHPAPLSFLSPVRQAALAGVRALSSSCHRSSLVDNKALLD
jgi:hypothetical protein